MYCLIFAFSYNIVPTPKRNASFHQALFEPSNRVYFRLVQVVKMPEVRKFFIPKNTEVLDSTLYLNEAFVLFKKNIEALSELDPTGLGLYLKASLSTSNKLLNATLPAGFEVPAIKSRVRVVKTQLLRCKYYSQQEDYELLNLGLIELFDSYDILLKRIDDVAQSEDALFVNEFEVKQELEDPKSRLRKN